jgi:hypothetical protein
MKPWTPTVFATEEPTHGSAPAAVSTPTAGTISPRASSAAAHAAGAREGANALLEDWLLLLGAGGPVPSTLPADFLPPALIPEPSDAGVDPDGAAISNGNAESNVPPRRVPLTLTVNREGHVIHAEPIATVSPSLLAAAIFAARRLSFQPALRRGVAVVATVRLTISLPAPRTETASRAGAAKRAGKRTPNAAE